MVMMMMIDDGDDDDDESGEETIEGDVESGRAGKGRGVLEGGFGLLRRACCFLMHEKRLLRRPVASLSYCEQLRMLLL